MVKTTGGSSASLWISGFVVLIVVLTSFALVRDLRATGAAATTEVALVAAETAPTQTAGDEKTRVAVGEESPGTTTAPDAVTEEPAGGAASDEGDLETEQAAGEHPPATAAPEAAATTTTAPPDAENPTVGAPENEPKQSTRTRRPWRDRHPRRRPAAARTAAPAPTTATTTTTTTTLPAPPGNTTTTTEAPAPQALPPVSGTPGSDFMPATTPYTGPMTITSGNQPDGGLVLRGFEISGSLTIDAGNLPYIVIADNYWHIPAAPGKALKIVSSSGDIQVFHNRFDGLRPDGSTVVGDVVAINSNQGLSHAEVYENLFVDIGSGDAAHTDIIVAFHAEMNVRRNRFARVSRFSSAIFYQSINGPTWGVVEDNIIQGQNHLIRAQSRKAGSGDLIVRGNTLDGPVSWIDPSWDGHLTWTGNTGNFEFHAA